jgi:metal-dependent amidase/aminoacylase/carboxypeptidase family protein
VIAARTIVAWQTIVAREKDPLEPAVITVGSIHGGTKHNIIPDEVHMQLTVRSYKDDVRKHLLDGIARIAKGEAEAAGAPKPPLVEVSESVPSVYNDPALTRRIAGALKQTFGDSAVAEEPPAMAGDDFAYYGRAGVPALEFSIGAVNPAQFAAAQKSGEILPGPHSPFFAPDREPSLRTGVEAEMTAVLELLGKP